ncbi:MAG TPA: hypothetical protein VKA84_00385 [Gemmatimonadaceae bacterium]|nr:hypothetical protein [Gemmatimonadaceae bacterium]
MKYILILAIGVAIGYGYGFSDAKKHNKSVVSRVLDRVGGSNRGKYDSDLDKKAEEASR